MDPKPGPDLCPFTSILSDEVLLMIIKHLDLEDIINLSQTCVKFNNLLKDRTICGHLRLRWHLKIARLDFVKFLRDGQRAAFITKLNLNDVYWVPSGVIRNIARPLTHLEELHIAGTQLSWAHLTEILSSSRNLRALSWSWDHRIEGSGSLSKEKSKFLEISSNKSLIANMGDLGSLQPALRRLKVLLLHVPVVQSFTSPTYAAHSGISYFIARCENLEHLWILSWPKTDAERKMMEIFGEHGFPDQLKLPKLRTFSFRIMGVPRVHAPKLVDTVLRSIAERNVLAPDQLEHLWLDHPLLSVRGRNAGVLNPWPNLDLNQVKTLSLPLMDGATRWWEGNTFNNVKHLQITDGLPRVVLLNGIFDAASELESIVIKAFNIKLDWNRFVETHPKLQEVSVCLDGYFPYPDICQALAKLHKLRKLSLPLYALLEIRVPSIVDNYRAALELDSEEEVHPGVFPNKSVVAKFEDSLFGKRVRIAMRNKSQDPDLAISGLDLITQACRNVEEFELGFSTKTRPGFLVVKSLSTLCKWKNLRRLTIEDVPIHDAQFLVDVGKSCRLEFLSLKSLGPRAKCIYIEDLCKALGHMNELRDFRLEQNHIGSSVRLLRSLQRCKKLRRFLLWAKSNDQPLDQRECLELMKSCGDLTVVYLTVGSTTKTTCETLRKTIEMNYKASRPGLSIIIRKGSDLEDEASPPVYPSVHYRQLVLFAPQVGQLTHFDSALQQ